MEKICIRCNRKFEASNGNAKFCSIECKFPPHPCTYPGCTNIATKSNYCSIACRNKGIALENKQGRMKDAQNRPEVKLKKSISQTKAFQNIEVWQKHNQSIKQGYLNGREAWNKGLNQKTIICKYCGKSFNVSDHVNKQFCSRSCSNCFNKTLKITDSNLGLLINLKKEGKSNDECMKAIGVDINIINKYVSNLIRSGIIDRPKKIAWNKGNTIKRTIKCERTKEQIKQNALKGHQTKKDNGSYKKSIQEDKVYEIIKKKYSDAIRQYSEDQRYPYACDFYIPSLDLFIEYQGHWTHGFGPYNGKNIPQEWIEKSNESDFYKNAIEIYTKNDSDKRKVVINNDLNFLEIWNFHNEEYLLKQIERSNGLFAKYSDICLRKELERIGNLDGCLEYNSQLNRIVLQYQPHFYEKENKLWRNPIVQNKIIQNRMHYLRKEEYDLTDKELLRGFKISGVHYGFSHFNPLLIKYFVKKYNIGSIYDPCAGWGHRLLGSCDCVYYGNDIDKRTVTGLEKIIKDFGLKNKTLFNYDAAIFSPIFDYDAVFTCPPYYDLEKYNNGHLEGFRGYRDWLEGFWFKLVDNSMKGCKKYFSFVINEKLKNDLIQICQRFPMKLIEESPILKHKSHFGNRDVLDNEYHIVFSLDV